MGLLTKTCISRSLYFFFQASPVYYSVFPCKSHVPISPVYIVMAFQYYYCVIYCTQLMAVPFTLQKSFSLTLSKSFVTIEGGSGRGINQPFWANLSCIAAAGICCCFQECPCSSYTGSHFHLGLYSFYCIESRSFRICITSNFRFLFVGFINYCYKTNSVLAI